MKNKGIISLVALVATVLAIFIIYGYNVAPAGVEQNTSNDVVNSDALMIKGPRIEVSPDSYDLGTVIYGDIPERTFVVKNSGSESLEILRLTTSCGCTVATIAEEDKIIAPGQSVDILVTFNPAVHKDSTDLGELTRVIYVKTNDSENSEVEVEIHANVIKNN